MNGDIKIGKLLCDEDIITKRQLNQALQAQIKGDKRALGEILVDKGFCTLDDITDVLMDEPQHKVEKEKVAEKVEDKNEPVELSEEKVMGTKFTMSVQTIGALAMVIASGVGGYYMLLQEIQEAKELPKIDIEASIKMNTHQDLKDIIGRGLKNNTTNRLEIYKMIWMMYLVGWKI